MRIGSKTTKTPKNKSKILPIKKNISPMESPFYLIQIFM